MVTEIMADGQLRDWVVDLDKATNSIRALANLVGVLKDNVEAWFDLKDLINERKNIARMHELISRLWTLNNLQSVMVLYSPKTSGFSKEIEEDLGNIEEFVRELRSFLEKRFAFLQVKDPSLYKDVQSALDARILAIQHISDPSNYEAPEHVFEKSEALLKEYRKLHTGMGQLLEKLSSTIDNG